MSEENKENKKNKATLIKHHKEEAPKNQSSPAKDKKKVVVVKKKVVVKKSPKANDESANKVVEEKKETKSEDKHKTTPSAEKSSTEQKSKPAAKPKSTGPRQAGNMSRPRRDYSQNNSGGSGQRYYNRGPGGQSSNYRGRQDSNNSGGYQGRQGGYQGRQGGQGGYQDRQGANLGGYQGRQGGYQGGQGGNQGRPGGYQGRQGGNQGRPGGYQGRPGGNQGRPGGYQGRPGGNQGRPGGYQGRPGGNQGRPGGAKPAEPQEFGKSTSKKFFKAKKSKEYGRKKSQVQEKTYQYKKKTVNNTNPIPKEIDIMEVITVSDLARKLNLKASDLISKLMGMGMMVTINQQIDSETATLLADEYGCKVKIVSLYDETIIESEKDDDSTMKGRPPIITVMGHVDHGKTKLLDAIRTTDVVAGEHGGITQHIGAYTVNTPKGDLTFLDTPGHAAFTLMRSRGAQITDIVVLVVAANDGVMPQTIEAINHAKEAKVPIIVAVNKVDLPEKNIEKVKQQMAEYDLMTEEWGGSTPFIEISALKKIGIDNLIERIALEAEMLDLKANWDCKAEGKIIESRVEQGRGVVATVLVERGILKVRDSFVAGIFSGKVKAMFDDKGNSVDQATPSTPVEVLGFGGVPSAGAPFQVTADERTAKQFSDKRQELRKHEDAKNVKKITLDNLYDSLQDGEVLELKVIIKGDVHGSVEAVQHALEKLSTSEIRLTCIHAAAGAIIENDVTLAAASNAIIVGFHVRPTARAQAIADQEHVEIRKYNVIYDAVEDIKSAMSGMLSPELKEQVIGQVEVRETFKVPKIGTVAGCMVKSGLVKRKSMVNVLRENIQIHQGTISTLRRFKDDAKEVAEGYECGIGIENYTDIQVGDILEIYEIIEVERKI